MGAHRGQGARGYSTRGAALLSSTNLPALSIRGRMKGVVVWERGHNCAWICGLAERRVSKQGLQGGRGLLRGGRSECRQDALLLLPVRHSGEGMEGVAVWEGGTQRANICSCCLCGGRGGGGGMSERVTDEKIGTWTWHGADGDGREWPLCACVRCVDVWVDAR